MCVLFAGLGRGLLHEGQTHLKLVVNQASLEEAVWLSSRLRSEDQQEVETSTGKPVEEVLLKAFDISAECFSLRFNDEPDLVALFGVAESSFGGVPWMLCTSEVTRGAIAIFREAPQWLNKWARQYGVLRNIVDLRNRLHIRWLVAAGCHFAFRSVWYNGHPFFTFTYRESKSCVIQLQSSPEPH